jgi:hypothetical protein
MIFLDTSPNNLLLDNFTHQNQEDKQRAQSQETQQRAQNQK